MMATCLGAVLAPGLVTGDGSKTGCDMPTPSRLLCGADELTLA